MKTARDKTIFASVILGIALLLSGCGLSGTQKVSGQTYTYANSSTSTSSTSTSSTSTSASTSSTGVAPASYRVGAYGYTSTSITVSTRTILKVKFTPGVQDQTMVGNGTSPQYSQLGVYIGVNGVSNPTAMLSNGLTTGTAQSSIMDLSSEFTPTCAATDTNCLQSIVIEISKPNYDYWCYNFGEYCPWSTVYAGHPWHGTLEVQTDLTDALQ